MRQKLIEFFNLLMGFRKFIAWTLLLSVAIIFRLMDYIDGLQWVDLMKTAFTGFVASNGVEYIASTVKDHLANVRATIDQAKPLDTPPQDTP